MIAAQDMTTEKNSTDTDKAVSVCEPEFSGYTQEIHSHHAKQYRKPDKPCIFLFEKYKTDDRDQQHIHCGNESRFSGCGVNQPHLLQYACQRQKASAAYSAYDRAFFVLFLFFNRSIFGEVPPVPLRQ